MSTSSPHPPPEPEERAPAPSRSRGVPLTITVAVVAIVGLGALLAARAQERTNKVALASAPKPVTVVAAKAAPYHATRSYVGRLDPWVAASVGPQFVSAYVDTVLVRPGAVVKKGQVLATLDCRNESATAQAIEMQARALDEQQKALSHEATRVGGLLDGGFVSPNEAEQKSAQSAAKLAEVLAEKAKLLGTSLEVNDCILRAPFDGDVATRSIDPGAFVRPGMPIVSIVDRSTVRMTADVPENDFDVVTPDKKVRIFEYATGAEIGGTIARRSPAADPATRTVHVEVDVPDPAHAIPVGTTGEVRVDVADPVPATSIPLAAATMRDTKATVYFVDGETAHVKTFLSLGEANGLLYAKPSDVPAGARVVTEGRGLLREGDRVTASVDRAALGADAPSKLDDALEAPPDGSVAATGSKP
jgi:RND family efflux transporter MFP subunit